jgi:hypothetical protein
MQNELDGEVYPATIQILGVNGAGLEAGNASICMDRDLPWLQDTTTDMVWASWNVDFRDVVVLDTAGNQVAVYNLTVHNLADPMNFAELKALLVQVAGGP